MRSPPALAAALLLGAGCFSTPGFSGARDGGGSGDDGGSGSGADGGIGEFLMSVVDGTMTGTQTVVLGPNLRLVFANAFGKMPQSLRTRTSNNEWLAFSNGLYEERGIGVSFSNRHIVGPVDSTVNGTATKFEVMETGPARAKIRITWGISHPCSGDTSDLAGNTTTFSIYPDGRIARHDEITAAHEQAMCMTNVGVYHSFDGASRSFFRDFNGMTEGSAIAVPPAIVTQDTTDAPSQRGFACLADSDAALGTGFTNPNTASEWSFFETIRAPTGDIGFNYMVNEGESLSLSHPYIADTLTALQPGSCQDLGTNVFGLYEDPPALGGANWVPAEAAYVPNALHVRPSVAMPAGTVFVLQESQVPALTLDGEILVQGPDYLAQDAVGGALEGAVLYLRRPLAADADLVIGAN